MRRWAGRWCGRERDALAAARYAGLLLLMNAGTVSYGLALGWVSLASGEGGYGGGGGEAVDAGLVWGAASTFAGALLGVVLAARALVFPRKIALLLVSVLFTLCWTLKLVALAGDSGSAGGGAGAGWRWWVVALGRVCAGLAGNLAWCLAPVFAKEMSVGGGFAGGAGASVPAVAHNVGMLLMYLAADCRLHPQTVVWWCCVCSAAHCCLVMVLVPESPAFLAAHNRRKEAVEVLSWLRARRGEDAALAADAARLPPPIAHPRSTLTVVRDMWSGGWGTRRRVAACVWLVAGQQLCGVLALEQFAERAFLMLADTNAGVLADTLPPTHLPTSVLTAGPVTLTTHSMQSEPGGFQTASPLAEQPPPGGGPPNPPITAARFALILGAAQLVASIIELYLIDRVSHWVLIVSSGVCTTACLSASAALAGAGRGAGWAGGALVAATAADSLGLHPVPYAVITEIFHYEERGAVLCVSYAAEELVSGLQTVGYAALGAGGGVSTAVGAAAAATAAYCVSAVLVLPRPAPAPADNHKQLQVTHC